MRIATGQTKDAVSPRTASSDFTQISQDVVDWPGHALHLTSNMLTDMLGGGLSNDQLLGHDLISSSDHASVHPVGAPHDGHEYQPEYGFKSTVRSDRPVFREIVCIIEFGDRPLNANRCRWSLNLYQIESVEGGIRADPLLPMYSSTRIEMRTERFLGRVKELIRSLRRHKSNQKPSWIGS